MDASTTAAAGSRMRGKTLRRPTTRSVQRLMDRTRSGQSTTTPWTRLWQRERRMLGVNGDSVRPPVLPPADAQVKESLFGSRSTRSSRQREARCLTSRTGRDSLRLSRRSQMRTAHRPMPRSHLPGRLPVVLPLPICAGIVDPGSTLSVPWACLATATR